MMLVTSLNCWWPIGDDEDHFFRLKSHQDSDFVTNISNLSPPESHKIIVDECVDDKFEISVTDLVVFVTKN